MAANQISSQIFIGGCSRSGTTLLGAMLGTHSQCICTPESHFKIELLRPLINKPDAIDITAVANRLNKHWRFQIWDLPIESDNVLSEADGAGFSDLLNWVTSQYAQHEKKSSATTWVDHTPENISYASSLLQIFPNAKFIHIVRDGRAVATSIRPLDWGPNTIIKASRWWMRMVSFGLAAESELTNDRIIRVRYEDLVLNPEGTLRQLCDFLGFEYEPTMPEATGFRPPQYTTQQHKLVGKSAKTTSVSRWKETLTPREIEIFENQTRNFLTHLGYDMEYGLTAKGPSFVEIQKDKAHELLRGELVNKLKWLMRSYPLWLKPDFYAFARLSDSNN
ncbi:MAG: sulfotransferase [Chloroflexi bacterium]|nr:sulfotransferase [Chloroflexota bacterium]